MRSDLLRDEGGAALIEAALVLPILLLILFGAMDLSLYLHQGGLAAKASQLGLRKAVVSSPVAAGPGLTEAQSATYWDGLPLGTRCTPEGGARGPCRSFEVRCGAAFGCTCPGGGCGYGLVRENLAPILAAMRAVLPRLRPEQVEIAYRTNGLGYVGRPIPVPVDVTVSIVGLTYEFWLLAPLAGFAPPLRASATLSAEDLASP